MQKLYVLHIFNHKVIYLFDSKYFTHNQKFYVKILNIETQPKNFHAVHDLKCVIVLKLKKNIYRSFHTFLAYFILMENLL